MLRIVIVLGILVTLATGGCAAVISTNADHVVEWYGAAVDSAGTEYPPGVIVQYAIERSVGGAPYETVLDNLAHLGANVQHSVTLTAENHEAVRYRVKVTLLVDGEVAVQPEADRCVTDEFRWIGLYSGSCGVKRL